MKGEGGEADADLVPVQDGEVLGRIYRPTSRLVEAERLRVELDRAPQIGDGDSWLIAVESNHGYAPTARSNGGVQALARSNHDHSTAPSLTGQAKTLFPETKSLNLAE